MCNDIDHRHDYHEDIRKKPCRNHDSYCTEGHPLVGEDAWCLGRCGTILTTANCTTVLIVVDTLAGCDIRVGMPAVCRHTRMFLRVSLREVVVPGMSIGAIRKVKAVAQEILTFNVGAYACNAVIAGSCPLCYFKLLL